MTTLPHRDMGLAAVKAGADDTIFVSLVTGELVLLPGRVSRLAFNGEGWGFARRGAAWHAVGAVMRTLLGAGPDGRTYVEVDGRAQWLVELVAERAHRYGELALAGGDAPAKLKVYFKTVPLGANYMLWQIRDFQETL